MARPKRPASIRWFERLFYLGLVLATLNAWVAGVNFDAQTELGQSEIGFLVMYQVAITALNLLFLWLIAYRANNVARWIFIVLVALSVLAAFADIEHVRDLGDLALALTLGQSLLCAIEIWLLFRRDSGAWFAGRRPVDPGIFE